MTNFNALPPAGWYPHPSGNGAMAYWTGTEWNLAPAPVPTAPIVNRKARKQAERAEKQAQKDADKKAKADQLAVDRERAGRLLVREAFGGHTVEVYENGFVRVSMLMRDSVPFQRLLGVSSSADITKKTGLGRTLGAGATLGANLLSSNKRGDVYLTIVTDEKTYSLHTSAGLGAPRAAQSIVGTGNAVIGRGEQ